MIVSRIYGGLGNQMFQYASARQLATRLGTDLLLDVTQFQTYKLHDYAIHRFPLKSAEMSAEMAMHRPLRFGGKLWKRLFCSGCPPLKLVREKGLAWQALLANAADNSYLVGYWQSESYFATMRPQLLQELTLTESADGRDAEIIDEMRSTTSVAVHVRRGDYVSNAATNLVHGTCDSAYYQRSVTLLADQYGPLKLFVFSDDPAWCRDNLRLGHPTVFVDHNDTQRNCEDLRVMSHARHFVVANSSFSWWGAWLSTSVEKTVCAPARWFRTAKNDETDIVPRTWHRM